MTLKMECLSCYQPWAELIVAGIKPVENRTRISHYRGPRLIHAAQKFDANWTERLKPEALEIAKAHLKTVCSFPTKLPKGCIVGFVVQTGCIEPLNPVWPPDPRYDWYEGPYGLKMEYPVKLSTPIPHVGRQGPFKADVTGKITPVDSIKIISQMMRWKNGN